MNPRSRRIRSRKRKADPRSLFSLSGIRKKSSMQKPIRVLYEDDMVIVFDKPSGILTIPSPQNEKHTLISLVNEQFSSPQYQLHVCHRLDRETSGAIMFAKGKAQQQIMMKAFQRHAVRKKYIAFARGAVRPSVSEIRTPVEDFHQKKFHGEGHPGQWGARSRTCPWRGSTGRSRSLDRKRLPQPAITRYKVLETRRFFSVLEVEPVTGRTNQIRIHFAQRGFPLLGERLYAFGKDFEIKFRRIALHSHQLSWQHPKTHKSIAVVCELAEDMQRFWEES